MSTSVEEQALGDNNNKVVKSSSRSEARSELCHIVISIRTKYVLDKYDLRSLIIESSIFEIQNNRTYDTTILRM